VTETRVAAAVVAMKTTVATAMVGAQTRTINNQLKVAAAMATKTTMVTAMTMTTAMMATVVAVAVAVAVAVVVAVTVGGGNKSLVD
jgi:hypothetical protein